MKHSFTSYPIYLFTVEEKKKSEYIYQDCVLLYTLNITFVLGLGKAVLPECQKNACKNYTFSVFGITLPNPELNKIYTEMHFYDLLAFSNCWQWKHYAWQTLLFKLFFSSFLEHKLLAEIAKKGSSQSAGPQMQHLYQTTGVNNVYLSQMIPFQVANVNFWNWQASSWSVGTTGNTDCE